MSNDDVTQDLTNTDKEANTTQPTITAVFRLLRDVQEGQTSLSSRFDALESSVNARFDALELSINTRFETLETSVNSRFDALESRLDRDFASVDTRFAEMSDEMKTGLLQLSDKLRDAIDRTRVHAEADIENIARRLRKLESKAS
jgi:uncharacterized phage infection (PIP) family protein YhgE